MKPATLASFQEELGRLVTQFEKNLAHYKSGTYDEASLRNEFLNPFFRALGWDVENKAGHIPKHREVELESRTEIAGQMKFADYLFRIDRADRFVCEAKKPAERIDQPRHIFQAKRYAWNKNPPFALLTDFEDWKFYVVGGKPFIDEPNVGHWRSFHFKELLLNAQEIWNLFARDQVAGGSIDRFLEGLPKKPARKGGKGQQLYLIKPDRSRALDEDFLAVLDEARRTLGNNLLRHNDRAELLEGTNLNDAIQRILDRILFLRICEDREIDTGRKLATIVGRDREKKSGGGAQPPLLILDEDAAGYGGAKAAPAEGRLWRALVRHFGELDHRPPTTVPFFNGNLFKKHYCDTLVVGDDWLFDFIRLLSDEETPYLFHAIPVEILGTIYERFLGKIVRPQGRGATIEEKPEVRKAGGVYYTPRYIVDYIVEQTVGKLLEGRTPEASLELRILDPACGSGSFLIRAFERVCEHWQEWLTKNPERRKKDWCWTDPVTNDVHLTSALKGRILTNTIYGVDLDGGAVEVSQLSLYLKMLEGESRTSLQRDRDLFGNDAPLLPPLQDNVKQGNSLIASDFSLDPDDLVRVHAFDWNIGFKAIMKAGGFDAVIGNPPYIRIQTLQESDPDSVAYLHRHFASAAKGNYDIYVVFVEQALKLLNSRGLHGFILPHKFFNAQYGEALRGFLATGRHVRGITHFGHQQVFEGATTYTCLLFTQKTPSPSLRFARVDDLTAWAARRTEEASDIQADKLRDNDWVFAAGPAASLLDRLRQQPQTLETVTDRIFQGLKTSADKIYVVEERGRKRDLVLIWSPEKQAEYWIESDLLHPLIKGGDSRRFAMTKTNRLILFPYRTDREGNVGLISQEELKRTFPRTWVYLNDNKSYLDNRENGRFRGRDWYQFGRSQALDVMPLPKLFTPDLASCASFSLDETGECFFTGGVAGGYGLLAKESVSPRFLLGLLNSRLLNWVIAQTGTQMRGGYFSFEARFIRSLPVPQPDMKNPADKSRHDQMVKLVDKMLGLMPKLRTAKAESERQTLQNAVDATDQEIDALVYELYGLTKDEIALVEGGT